MAVFIVSPPYIIMPSQWSISCWMIWAVQPVKVLSRSWNLSFCQRTLMDCQRRTRRTPVEREASLLCIIGPGPLDDLRVEHDHVLSPLSKTMIRLFTPDHGGWPPPPPHPACCTTSVPQKAAGGAGFWGAGSAPLRQKGFILTDLSNHSLELLLPVARRPPDAAHAILTRRVRRKGKGPSADSTGAALSTVSV